MLMVADITLTLFRRNELKTLFYRLLLAAFALIAAQAQASLPPPLEQQKTPDTPVTSGGEVRVPLPDYTHLLEQAKPQDKPAPAPYAIGQASATVTVENHEQRQMAQVAIELDVQVQEDQWTQIPLLASHTALSKAEVDGQAVQLVNGAEGLSWVSRQAGRYHLLLEYRLDASGNERGWQLALSLPPAAGTDLLLELPGTQLDVAVAPAVGVTQTEQDSNTQVKAQVPATRLAQITWQQPTLDGYSISRAFYRGELKEDALFWEAVLQVEVFGKEQFKLPLLPANVILSGARVDGETAVLLVEKPENPSFKRSKGAPSNNQENWLSTLVKGVGQHQVQLLFQTPVTQDKGPPSAVLHSLPVPISKIELQLPGRKEVSIKPAASVQARYEGEGEALQTVAAAHVPLSEQVTLSWTEAVPEEAQDQLRANASLYHAVHAEEGVLHGRAFIHYEITRSETSVLHLEMPPDVQINRIQATGGGVADWRAQCVGKTTAKPQPPSDSNAAAPAGGSDSCEKQQVSVFLDRQVKGEFQFEVQYERLLGGPSGDTAASINIPLLRATQVHRQRGMLALLSGQELALQPVQAERVSKVGENQLPSFVRQALQMTVAHTYKYTDSNPQVNAKAVAPERKAGKFDAQVDTLISIGDVTLKGATTLELNVKSGSLMSLQLQLPTSVNLLGLSSPALRTYQVKTSDAVQNVQVDFTQEIQGQFRIELNYEQILPEGGEASAVPTPAVPDAEVEFGRIAVEALAAVEVQAATLESLSTLDLNELPQQLVLKTTNPILLAYRYVHPPYSLKLKITRHQEVEVQVASIEQAQYDTLLTRDGLEVTTASYTVRNSRKQFLRLQLPQGAEVWSAEVGGKGEKPARADDGRSVLLKMINATSGFPLQLVYAVQHDKITQRGQIQLQLPRPDILVTHTRWDAYLPAGVEYRRPDTNLEIRSGAFMQNVSIPDSLSRKAAPQYQQNNSLQLNLQLNVPKQGVQFAFEKLYANKAAEDAGFSVNYISKATRAWGFWLNLFGTLLLGFWLLVWRFKLLNLPPVTGIAALALGLASLTAAFFLFYANPLHLFWQALGVALLMGIILWRRRFLA